METSVQPVNGGWFVIHRVGPPELGEVHATPEQDGMICAACADPITAGELVAAVPLGPGSDREQRARCLAGHHYDAQTAIVHWACATGDEVRS